MKTKSNTKNAFSISSMELIKQCAAPHSQDCQWAVTVAACCILVSIVFFAMFFKTGL